jgi:SAM-dependent methyltransferase
MEPNRKNASTFLKDVSAYYDALASRYDALYLDAASRYENAVVQTTLQRLEVDDTEVLDLGCGTGLFLDMGFHPRHYLGVDISEEMVHVARQKHPNWTFCVGDMASSVSERYDTVIVLFGGASQALHVSMLDLMRHLLPGGRFCLMVFADGQGDRLGWRCDRACPDVMPLRVRYYSVRGLRKALASMEAVRVRGLNVCLPITARPSRARFAVNALLERLLPSRAAFLIATGRKPHHAP